MQPGVEPRISKDIWQVLVRVGKETSGGEHQIWIYLFYKA